jgi:ketosteroid isomerase-like protein
VEEARGDAGLSIELIREMNEAVWARDSDAFVDRCHPDAVWEHNIGGGSPEEGVYEGREQIRQLFQRILDGFEDIRPIPAEVTETDTGVYLVRGELRCKLADSDAVIVEPYEQRLRIHDGLLSRCRMDFGDAVRA